MIDSDNYVMLSALQHFAFCPRQCALIHIEQVWSENIFTLRGLRVHETVDTPGHEQVEAEIRVERSLPLVSHQLRIKGIADVVEFWADGTPHPVEYKSGSRKLREADNIQLCAQALCLEEMLDCRVTSGSIFHHGSRRRRTIDLDQTLRSRTLEVIEATRLLLQSERLPPPVSDQRCKDCSLIESCMPEAISQFDRLALKQDLFRIDEQ